MDQISLYLPGIILAYSAFLLSIISPGPNVLAVLGTSMSAGRGSGLALALGVASGSFIWALMTALGLSALLASYAVALTVIKIVGGLYLLWLAYKSFRAAASRHDIEAVALTGGARGYYLRGLTIQMTNPKAALAWIAVISLGLQPGAPIWVALVIVVGTSVLSALIHCLYAVAFSTTAMVRAYGRARRWIPGHARRLLLLRRRQAPHEQDLESRSPMRLVAWNCAMALHRKFEALLALKPDVAVISECAEPARLEAHGLDYGAGRPLWIGDNPNKGLAVFAFNGYRLRIADDYQATLRWIAPVRVEGPQSFNLLAVWAQNLSGGVSRKKQSGPFRRALSRYRDLLSDGPAFVAGDLNNNVIWDRPGWRINHAVGGRQARRPGPRQRLSRAQRRTAGRRNRADHLLARPHQGRADLSPRLHLHAARPPGPGPRVPCRLVRGLVRRPLERSCAGGARH